MFTEQEIEETLECHVGYDYGHDKVYGKDKVAKIIHSQHLAECERLMENELVRFFDWFQRNQFKMMKRNPKFVPGEGYSGAPNHEWSITEVLEMYHKENPPKSDKNETERLMEIAFNAAREPHRSVDMKTIHNYPPKYDTFQDFKNSLNNEK